MVPVAVMVSVTVPPASAVPPLGGVPPFWIFIVTVWAALSAVSEMTIVSIQCPVVKVDPLNRFLFDPVPPIVAVVFALMPVTSETIDRPWSVMTTLPVLLWYVPVSPL